MDRQPVLYQLKHSGFDEEDVKAAMDILAERGWAIIDVRNDTGLFTCRLMKKINRGKRCTFKPYPRNPSQSLRLRAVLEKPAAYAEEADK